MICTGRSCDSRSPDEARAQPGATEGKGGQVVEGLAVDLDFTSERGDPWALWAGGLWDPGGLSGRLAAKAWCSDLLGCPAVQLCDGRLGRMGRKGCDF